MYLFIPPAPYPPMAHALVLVVRWENRDLKGLSDLVRAFCIPFWVCCLDLVLPALQTLDPGMLCEPNLLQ